jgi:hypothetical protein
MGVYAELRGFVLAHRACGILRGDHVEDSALGYRLWIVCPCGARFERQFGPDDADADRLRAVLLQFER